MTKPRKPFAFPDLRKEVLIDCISIQIHDWVYNMYVGGELLTSAAKPFRDVGDRAEIVALALEHYAHADYAWNMLKNISKCVPNATRHEPDPKLLKRWLDEWTKDGISRPVQYFRMYARAMIEWFQGADFEESA